jgi:hypothetical protein
MILYEVNKGRDLNESHSIMIQINFGYISPLGVQEEEGLVFLRRIKKLKRKIATSYQNTYPNRICLMGLNMT